MSDRDFVGSIPEFYESTLVPLIFEQYAARVAALVHARKPARVLEIAAGTGVLTRQLAEILPAEAQIIATDLNQPMLDVAASSGISREIIWRQADALALPFSEGEFDVVVCQFGVMFFPDKVAAFGEALRVLRPGGVYVFAVWDRIEENEFADVVTRSLSELFPDDPPLFLRRTPHGYYDVEHIRRDLKTAGFPARASIETVAARSRAGSPRDPAMAYCYGTVLQSEIEARSPGGVERATQHATDAIAAAFGSGVVDSKIQAHIVTVERP